VDPITLVVIAVIAVVVLVPLTRGFWKEVGGARGAGRLVGDSDARKRRRRSDDDYDAQ
jgi:hypothetical protein